MKRALAIVLDSVGCGGAPDAEKYGDQGADTLGHLYGRIDGFRLPHLESLGLGKLLGLEGHEERPSFHCARLTAHAAGKDTTTGHWELMGHVLTTPFDTFREFPAPFLVELEELCGTGFLGNYPASGTEIIQELGAEHLASGKPILYTSADSVLQIAAHEEQFGVERLMQLCRISRKLLDESGMRVGRVIARPFTGDQTTGFQRTANRHDFSIKPGETALNRLRARDVHTIGIGKISDIFAGSGIGESNPTKSNAEGMATIERLWNAAHQAPVFLFANLVDFDSLYGHRRNPEGYARCLTDFDVWLGSFLEQIDETDAILITADHGNDPYHRGTDHTREQVPLLYQAPGTTLRPSSFADTGQIIESYFDTTPNQT